MPAARRIAEEGLGVVRRSLIVRAVTSEATACESGCSAYESITSGMRATREYVAAAEEPAWLIADIS
jgi:hypothetical protein